MLKAALRLGYRKGKPAPSGVALEKAENDTRCVKSGSHKVAHQRTVLLAIAARHGTGGLGVL
jgi:hypothetical protein